MTDGIIQGEAQAAETILPVIHVLFSNVEAWLNGTFHGVSAKHLPRYATAWTYRFNRRGRIDELAQLVLRRALECRTISCRQLVDRLKPQGTIPASSG